MKDLEHAEDVSYSLAHNLNSTLKDKKTLEIENETLKQKVTCRGPRVAEYKQEAHGPHRSPELTAVNMYM